MFQSDGMNRICTIIIKSKNIIAGFFILLLLSIVCYKYNHIIIAQLNKKIT
jgi:hypothetical protein